MYRDLLVSEGVAHRKLLGLPLSLVSLFRVKGIVHLDRYFH
jgi:hypothetical protein